MFLTELFLTIFIMNICLSKQSASVDPQKFGKGTSESGTCQSITEEIYAGIHKCAQNMNVTKPVKSCATATFTESNKVHHYS